MGWSAALGFCMITIVFPLLQFFSPESPVPVLDSELVLITLGGLLGMGSLRTYEKYKGILLLSDKSQTSSKCQEPKSKYTIKNHHLLSP